MCIAAGIQRSVAFGDQIAAVVARVFFIIAFIGRASRVVEFVRVVIPPPVIIALFVDVVVHVGIRDRRAEKVIRINRKLNFLADGYEWLRRLNGDFELGLLVLLNLEIATSAGFAN